MKLIPRILISLFILLTAEKASAQFDCVDPAKVNDYYQCYDPYYNPVCGCNNITYRNQCTALYRYGVNYWRTGVCTGIDLDFLPNPALTGYNLTINLSFDESVYGHATVRIVDMYAKTFFQRQFNNFNRISYELDVSSFKTGVYLIVVEPSVGTPIVKLMTKA